MFRFDGKSYRFCVDLGALAEAEQHFAGQGHAVDLVASIPLLARDVSLVTLTL